MLASMGLLSCTGLLCLASVLLVQANLKCATAIYRHSEKCAADIWFFCSTASTAKPLACLAHAAVLLEAVAEDIREYLRSRRDTIRCIVTMLTDDSAGANAEGEGEGESLFEELKRTVADEVRAVCSLPWVSMSLTPHSS